MSSAVFSAGIVGYVTPVMMIVATVVVLNQLGTVANTFSVVASPQKLLMMRSKEN